MNPPTDEAGRSARDLITDAQLEALLRATGVRPPGSRRACGTGTHRHAGLDPDQALASVLLTSRMSRRIAGDTLWIDSLDPAGARP